MPPSPAADASERQKREKEPRALFEGPIFIVGLPRSGTKLLRELLNNHSRVSIAIKESNSIPYYYHRRENFGDLSVKENFAKFYEEFSRTKFFRRLDNRDKFIDLDSWYGQLKEGSFAEVIEVLYKTYARHFNKEIWGDKTPSYIVQVPLLKSLFPKGKFIHIYRDGRDQALSIHNVYKKNIYTSAQRWFDVISKFHRDVKACAEGDWLEVRYEDVTDETEATMKKVCDFLGISFEPGMTEMDRAVEGRSGAASRMKGILKGNHGKWKKKLTKSQVRKMESICGSMLHKLGYETTYNGTPRRMNALSQRIYQGIDAFNLLVYEVRRRDIAEGVRSFVEMRKKGWFHQ